MSFYFSSLCKIYLAISLSIDSFTSLAWGTNTLIIFVVYSISVLKSITFLAFIIFDTLASNTIYLSRPKSWFWNSFYYSWLLPCS